jgi:hypothetical protein
MHCASAVPSSEDHAHELMNQTEVLTPDTAACTAHLPCLQGEEDAHELFGDAEEELADEADVEAVTDPESANAASSFAALRKQLKQRQQQQESDDADNSDDAEADEDASDEEGSDVEGDEKGSKAERAAKHAEQRSQLQRLLEDYYKLDYEDNIGGLACRFKYREVRYALELQLAMVCSYQATPYSAQVIPAGVCKHGRTGLAIWVAAEAAANLAFSSVVACPVVACREVDPVNMLSLDLSRVTWHHTADCVFGLLHAHEEVRCKAVLGLCCHLSTTRL